LTGIQAKLKRFWNKLRSPGLVFSVFTLGLYLFLWWKAPEKTLLAVRCSLGMLSHILLPLCMVFLLMVGLNLFLKPPQFTKPLKKGAKIRQTLLAALAGILSAGPIYAWYPMLKDLREKGADHSLIAVFLVNRAVKPFLLPVMVSFFGWAYVLILTILTVAGSLCIGSIVGIFLDRGIGFPKNWDA
jgi:uncharacterized membrane protein YraQ (UPF0718 family)